MTRRSEIRPAVVELAVLRVLWERGPCTARQVHEALADRGVQYTTTLKTMQNMTEKGLLDRDESARSHVYRAAVEEEPTQRQLLGDLLERAFGGAAGKLVLQALAAGKLSAQEVKEIRKVLNQKREEQE